MINYLLWKVIKLMCHLKKKFFLFCNFFFFFLVMSLVFWRCHCTNNTCFVCNVQSDKSLTKFTWGFHHKKFKLFRSQYLHEYRFNIIIKASPFLRRFALRYLSNRWPLANYVLPRRATLSHKYTHYKLGKKLRSYLRGNRSCGGNGLPN